MSAFVPPTGSAPAAGSASTPAGNDVSLADMGQMGGANPESDTSGDNMTMGQLQPAYSAPGQQAPAHLHNYTPTGTPGQYAHHAPGHTAPAGRPNISTAHGVSTAGLGKVIAHLRGSAGSSVSKTEKGPHPSAGNKSAGLKSNGEAKAPTKK